MPEAESSALQHDYEIFIRTTPDALWDAITRGEHTRRYFHGTRIESEWRVGAAVIYHSSHAGNIAVDGEVRHVERTRRLSYTWNVRYDPERSGEAPSLVTWKIEPVGDTCRLTLTASVSSRSRTAPRRGRVSNPSRVRRSRALAISVRVHTQVTIRSSSESHVRTSALSGSETISATSAEASQYLTGGRPAPRPTPVRDSPATPAAARPESTPRLPCPGAGGRR